MGFAHKDKNGNITELKDLGLNHLKNIIAYIERRAKEGLIISFGGSGCSAEDMWYDEDVYYGKQARKKLNYKNYLNELKTRENTSSNM
tara:strand:- start:25 stop:288 length:264 start_codon:yes stop_codon:yes gene_type:complete